VTYIDLPTVARGLATIGIAGITILGRESAPIAYAGGAEGMNFVVFRRDPEEALMGVCAVHRMFEAPAWLAVVTTATYHEVIDGVDSGSYDALSAVVVDRHGHEASVAVRYTLTDGGRIDAGEPSYTGCGFNEGRIEGTVSDSLRAAWRRLVAIEQADVN